MAKNIVVHGVIYNGIRKISFPLANSLGKATFYDISNATVIADDILAGKIAYGPEGSVTGSIQNNGDVSGTISTKSGTVTIPEGYTSGGTVCISSTERNKIIAANIRSGAKILGVSGAPNVVNTSIGEGAATQDDILEGHSAYVNGLLVNGRFKRIVAEQDPTTKVLYIS